MKILKFNLVFLLTIVSLQLIAQPGNVDPEERMKRQTERLTTELDLTQDQAQQVEAINREQMEKMMQARQETQGDREAMREMRQKSNAEREAKYKDIFTQEQWTKFEQLKAENQEGLPGPKGPNPGPKKGKKKKKKKNGDGS